MKEKESLSFSDLVLREQPADTSRPKARKKAAPVFSIALNSNPDFAIRKETTRSSKLLVMLVSQGQFYVKDEKTGGVTVIMHHDEHDDTMRCSEGWKKALTDFTRGMSDGLELGGQWLRRMESGTEFANRLCEALSNPSYFAAARSGMLACVAPEDLSRRYVLHDSSSMAISFAKNYKALARTAMRLAAERPDLVGGCMQAALECAEVVEDAFGVDDARKFVDRLVEALPEHMSEAEFRQRRYDMLPSWSAIADILAMPANWQDASSHGVRFEGHFYWGYRSEPALDLGEADGYERVRFDYERFEDYLLGQSRREGMDLSMCTWSTCWRDDLVQQLLVHGHILEKYPENLLSHHQKVTREWGAIADGLMRADDAEKWAAAERALSGYDWNPDGAAYVISHPSCTEDMVREADGQGNCLRSYIDSVKQRTTDILFCRKSAEPEAPFVTLEVRDRRLVQAYARFNRTVDVATQSFLRDWCIEKGIAWDSRWLPAVA